MATPFVSNQDVTSTISPTGDMVAQLSTDSSVNHTTVVSNAALFISHELRTPLTSIQAVLHLLANPKYGALTQEGQRLLGIALSNSERLVRLANAIEKQPNSSLIVFSEETIKKLQLENDLHQALARQEMQLVYQPIISISTGHVIGFEGLLRWHHRNQGIIPPSVFITIAEQTGFIHELGLWVLQQGCEQLARWQQAFPIEDPLTMSLNLSAVQLQNPTLVCELQRIITETGIQPNTLKLEITESVLIEDYHRAVAVLAKLKAIGIQLYIDDFGTRYASLAQLQNLPIDGLKIDRVFVQKQLWALSEAIVHLASTLDLDVIAEGVELVSDLISLKQLGCTRVQGYFFSRPVDAEIADNLIATSYAIS
ncbi:MAG: EAL domain-containing protein [Cyanobacteria bacterium]|nr:EAL domain-containing protein [Cyanobacteriota bacterium]MDW8201792.1 EAL domain-containing protein [Cyanobacteriota bacterium SKYGB_h_bin112]